MYLSQLILNPRSRQVQRELADPYEMHRTVMSAFPTDLPEDERVLFRLEQNPRTNQLSLLVQSQHAPVWEPLSASGKSYLLLTEACPDGLLNPAVKRVELDGKLTPSQLLVFRLRANPTVKKKAEGKKNGRRVGLYRQEEQLQWLQRKLEAAGCKLIEARIVNQDRIYTKRRRGNQMRVMQFVSVGFDGLLQVEHPVRFLEAVNNGIGSGKGLGFGLLSLAPWRG
jgi:CRISPR system Cascade subunit CasE